MTGPELGRFAQVTYRCIDHWARRGYIRPSSPVSGSGNVREFSQQEADICRRMARLIRVGLRPEVAAVAAREWIAGGGAAYLGEGIVITADAASRAVAS